MNTPYSIIELLELTCKGLESRGIDYMVSGSIAMSIYSDTRNTRDIDLVVNLKKEDVDVFLEIFNNGFFYSRESIVKDIENKSMFNIISTTTAYKLDFIVKKDGEYRNTEFNRKIKKLILNKFEAWIVSPEDLIISKFLWIQQTESELQKRDLKELLALKNIDSNYISQWITKLKINTFNLI